MKKRSLVILHFRASSTSQDFLSYAKFHKAQTRFQTSNFPVCFYPDLLPRPLPVAADNLKSLSLTLQRARDLSYSAPEPNTIIGHFAPACLARFLNISIFGSATCSKVASGLTRTPRAAECIMKSTLFPAKNESTLPLSSKFNSELRGDKSSCFFPRNSFRRRALTTMLFCSPFTSLTAA